LERDQTLDVPNAPFHGKKISGQDLQEMVLQEDGMWLLVKIQEEKFWLPIKRQYG
jgi:hypothetical protein